MASTVSAVSQVRLAALGGLGEIGLNCMLLECGAECLLIDAGVMFPEDRWLGVDVIIPEFAALAHGERRLLGVILTHAHEDHIGALPMLLRRFPMPVYGSELTLAFARRRLQERGGLADAQLTPIAPGKPFSLGPFEIEPLRVTHSTPDSLALAIDTPAGLIVHSGDFKIDDAPVDGVGFDRERFEELGRRGVAILLSDSTNVERAGRSPSESSLKPIIRELMSRTRGKFFLSSFSSHIHRIRQVAEVSRELGRAVVPLGRRIVESTRLGMEHGQIQLPPGTFIEQAEAEFLPADRLSFIASGSQGEPLSALVKIASDHHPRVRLDAGDTVVLSSRFIPGNERTINNLINHLYRRGADVYYDAVAPVHVSGHASRDELAELIRLTRPRHFVPIHGEYRHLSRHLSLAIECGVPERNCYLLENGETLVLGGARSHRGRGIETGRAMVTGGELSDLEMLRERRWLARDGTVIAVVVVAEDTGQIIGGPELISRGFVTGDGASAELRRARAELQAHLAALGSGVGAEGAARLKDELSRGLSRFFAEEMDRRPAVVPCVIKV